jgi:hypothetical protein
MKTKITLLILSIFSFFAPIELCSILLMVIIFIDTVVKLISLKKIACAENKKYMQVFKSKILRKGYIFKAAGYYILAMALFPLDYYALTPFTNSIIKALEYSFLIPTRQYLLICFYVYLL